MTTVRLREVAVLDAKADWLDTVGDHNRAHDIRQLAGEWFTEWLTDQMTRPAEATVTPEAER